MGPLVRIAAVGLLTGLVTLVAPGAVRDAAAADDDRFYLRTVNAGGGADIAFSFGRPDDTAVVGDWDGNGTQTIGVRRGNRYFLRNSNSAGFANRDFRFGRSGDVPVVGDWNGDGTQTIGVRRGNRFLLRNSNSGGFANLDFQFGRSSDVPVVGDWDGDGIDTVGVRRGNRYFLRNSNSSGFANLDFQFGRSGDVPVVGDWDGDGVDTVGVRRGNRFFLRNRNSSGFANLDFQFGRKDDVALTGDWTGNGVTTVGVRRIPPPPQVVSSFTTPLEAGAPRSVNVRRALELIDGDIIAPGASYSLDQAIGPRTSERGFLTNGFISSGELISVLGGGVSQSAVTFLNAAWFAGIDIVTFKPHSIYFTRYPMCREATISRNTIDLVVRNDSPYPITVDTTSTATSATVRFISRPWARVRSSTSAPTNIVGGRGGAFTVSCSRTITYPNGRSTTENYRWRYSEGYPG
jgi:hypothetical protein